MLSHSSLDSKRNSKQPPRYFISTALSCKKIKNIKEWFFMKDTCCILAAGGLWGMISVFIRTLQQAGFTSMQCVAIRAFFTALVLLLCVCAKDPRSLRIHLRDIPLFVGQSTSIIYHFLRA
jgi:drug/metabolite transporter (DMT)-like permease